MLLSADVFRTIRKWLSVARHAPSSFGPSCCNFGDLEDTSTTVMFLRRRNVSLEVTVMCHSGTAMPPKEHPFCKELVIVRSGTTRGVQYSVENRYTWWDPPEVGDGWICLVHLPEGKCRLVTDTVMIRDPLV